MQTELHIVMPSAKPQNIPAIAPSILQAEGCSLAIRWHILLQGADPDEKGFSKINTCLSYLPSDSWFWTPSDDSIHHPHFFRRLGEIIAANPECRAVVFSEERGPSENSRVLRAAPENMKPGAVDGSQCAWHRGFVGDQRYDWSGKGQDADGCFAQALYERDPKVFVFCDEILTRFNLLEWR